MPRTITLKQVVLEFLQSRLGRMLTVAAGVFAVLAAGLWGLISVINQNNSVTSEVVAETEVWKYIDRGGITHQLILEIADTEAERERGLMFRTDLAEGRGMLFIFPTPGKPTFWMQNTPLSLDIIFLNSNRQVVTIYRSTKPNQTTEVYPATAPAQFVIETVGGWASAVHLAEGDQFFL